MTKKMQLFNHPITTGIIIIVGAAMILSIFTVIFPTSKSSGAEKITLSLKINKLKQTIDKKNKELKTLNQSLIALTTDYARKAKTLVQTKGRQAALTYLQHLPEQPEAQVKQVMQKWADKYRLEAQLLMIGNQYNQAKQAYKKMIDFDSSANSLFIYARFLQKQSIFNEAITYYQQSLEKYQTLTKTNPDVYGVDLLKKPKANLEEAKIFLEHFEPTPRIQELLNLIEQLNKSS